MLGSFNFHHYFYTDHANLALDPLRKSPPAEPAVTAAAPTALARKSPVETRAASTNTQTPVDFPEQTRGENKSRCQLAVAVQCYHFSK